MMKLLDYSKAVTDFWSAGPRLAAGAGAAQGARQVQRRGRQDAKLPSMPYNLSGEAEDLARAAKSVVGLWSAATSACGASDNHSIDRRWRRVAEATSARW
jgi:hypothetical protein